MIAHCGYIKAPEWSERIYGLINKAGCKMLGCTDGTTRITRQRQVVAVVWSESARGVACFEITVNKLLSRARALICF
jgi:hypothetical protein